MQLELLANQYGSSCTLASTARAVLARKYSSSWLLASTARAVLAREQLNLLAREEREREVIIYGRWGGGRWRDEGVAITIRLMLLES